MLEQKKIYLKLVLRDGHVHPSQDEVISVFVYEYDTKNRSYYNISHPDVLPNSSWEKLNQYLADKTVFVINKKHHKYFLSGLDLHDANLVQFLNSGIILKSNRHPFVARLNTTHHNINKSGYIIPYAIHQAEFESEIEVVDGCMMGETSSYCYNFFNNVITDTLFEVEKNGLYVDEEKSKLCFPYARVKNNIVYSEYNIYNPTGRPSNKFDNVNYVALNKENGCRSSFISRYSNGKLLMVDFTGFHPYIVANLIGYKVPDDETIYEHLAKQYYNVDFVDGKLLSKAKKLTMVNMYGQIYDQYIHIPFFEHTEKLKNRYWAMFSKKGYVTTPIYKRKITNNHITDPNKNKLFSYIIQAAETEYGISSLNNCLKYCIGKEITPILYIYDGILFDISENIGENEINDIANIIRGHKFKVKVYTGNSYNDLELIKI